MDDIFKVLLAAGKVPSVSFQDFQSKVLAVDLKSIECFIFDKRARIAYVRSGDCEELLAELEMYVAKLINGLELQHVVVIVSALLSDPMYLLDDALVLAHSNRCKGEASDHNNARFYEDAFQIDDILAENMGKRFDCVSRLGSRTVDFVLSVDYMLLTSSHNVIFNIQGFEQLVEAKSGSVKCFTTAFTSLAVTPQMRCFAHLCHSRSFPGLFYVSQSRKNSQLFPEAVRYEEMVEYLSEDADESAARIITYPDIESVVRVADSPVYLRESQAIVQLVFSFIARNLTISAADLAFVRSYVPQATRYFTVSKDVAKTVESCPNLIARLRSIERTETRGAKLKAYRQLNGCLLSFDDFCYFSDIKVKPGNLCEELGLLGNAL